jgi:serine/threonine-protein kinase HipA
LLERLGLETVGAVVALPAGSPYPKGPSVDDKIRLSEFDIAGRLRRLEAAPLGVSEETNIRLSLGGVQSKLPLMQMDGEFLDPHFDRPSTVILKPEPSLWPRLAELEAWGLTIARESGIPAPAWEIREFEGIKTLLVNRYDRRVVDRRTVERDHQEDMCMAVGSLPQDKYSTKPNQRTSLRHLANILYANSSTPDDDIAMFARSVVLNVAIGNCDGHARNWAFLHPADGSVHLAPAYDVVPTFHYPGHVRQLAQPVAGNVMNPANVRWKHLQAELESWSIPTALDALEPAVAAVGDALRSVGLPNDSPELAALVGDFDRLRPN